MKYIELEQHIQNAMSGGGEFAPVYTIFGDDDRLCAKALKMFEGIVSSDYADFNLVKVASENDFADAIDALSTFPMFDEYKVVVVNMQNGFAKSKKQKSDDEIVDVEVDSPAKKLLDEYMLCPNPTSILVLDCDSKEIAKSVKYKGAKDVDCSRLDDEALKIEIAKLMSLPPVCTINPNAVEELIKRTQSGMGRIESEIKKLKDYVNGGVITLNDVCDMVVADIDFKLFELANAISQKDCDGALSVLNVFMENGLRGVTILNLIYNKYRDMLHILLNKNATREELMLLFNLSKPGAVFYLQKTASNYSQTRLKACVDYLHALQFDVVSGKRNEQSAVHEAVLKLLTI